MTEVIFSGVQPTGDLHIGNYYGAVKQFVGLQDKGHDGIYCIVDLHALTQKHDPKLLERHTLEITAAYLAAGLDPSSSTIFAQSTVHQHTEMAWFLNCVARMGWMERMTQFKDKAGGDNSERASVGLFTYPILMAADILLYGATHVPVGDDQRQHLELARDIARKFNKDFGATMAVPAALSSDAPRIMSLVNADSKMSKSSPDANSRINITDSADTIAKKIRKATADTMPFPEDLSGDIKPEVKNLITIFKAATGATDEAIVGEFGGKGYGVFKPALAEALIAEIVPLGERMSALMTDTDYLKGVLRDGQQKAETRAVSTIRNVKNTLGLVKL